MEWWPCVGVRQGDAPGGYLVRWRERWPGSLLGEGQVRSETHYTITGLMNGQAYVVRVDKLDADGHVVRGTNSAVAGIPSQDVTPTRAADLKVTAGDRSLSLRWTAALRAPNGYSVRWRERRPDSHLGPVNKVMGTTYTITGLINGMTYILRVDTRNAADTGVKLGTYVNAPGTPRALAASAGLPTVDVHDAQGEEGDALAFRITLSQAAAHPVTVRWRTEAGTARAGVDFTSGAGTALFEPSETVHTVSVQLLDDLHDDPGETFRGGADGCARGGRRRKRGGGDHSQQRSLARSVACALRSYDGGAGARWGDATLGGDALPRHAGHAGRDLRRRG